MLLATVKHTGEVYGLFTVRKASKKLCWEQETLETLDF